MVSRLFSQNPRMPENSLYISSMISSNFEEFETLCFKKMVFDMAKALLISGLCSSVNFLIFFTTELKKQGDFQR